ncbi:MAG TPA: cytochrome c oxidase subunit II [Acidimicrobiales bacterium]|nr:cytochrome c oxidase subunit II [Acidimicrobiales bacterium]
MLLHSPRRGFQRSVPLGAFVLAVGSSGCGASRFWAPEPVTREGDRILRLWQGSTIAAICVGALVWGLIGYVVFKYRRRDDNVPAQNPYNVPVEVVYTVAPILVVAVLFAFTFGTQRKVVSTSARPDLVVEVTGFQWQWQFHYPREQITVTGTPGAVPTLVLPVGQTVRFRLQSTDVIHSFWIPRFLSKRDLIPGIDNEVQVQVKERGTWVGRCAEFCGLDHYKMSFSVRAVAPAEFRRWAAEQRSGVAAGAGDTL